MVWFLYPQFNLYKIFKVLQFLLDFLFAGSPYLRRTLFQIMDGLIKRSPADDPVYAFMDKKRAQGKPYYVYMTAGANKFLRIYYGRVKEYLASLSEAEEI